MSSDFGVDLSVVFATIIDESASILVISLIFLIYSDIDKNDMIDYYQNLIYEHYMNVFIDKLPAQLFLLYIINHWIPVKIEKFWMILFYYFLEYNKRYLEIDIKFKLYMKIVVFITEFSLTISHMIVKKNFREYHHVQDL